MIKRLAGGTAVLALTLGLGAGVATAASDDPRPVKGTSACVDLVNGQSDVLIARGTVQHDTALLNAALRATSVDDALVASLRATLSEDQAKLRVIVGNVTDSLCTNKVADTTKPKPVETKTVTPAPVAAAPAPVMVRPEHSVEQTTVVRVVPTQDDGSTVTGNQVKVVPEGSASTGEA